MKKILHAILFASMAFIAGCGGINFSQVSPEAKGFSPGTIAVLPATVGEHESSRSIIDDAVSRKLLQTGAFENIVDSASIKNQLAGSTELAASMEGYIQRLNTLGISDANVAMKLKDALHADAFFLTYVSSWEYGRQEGNKVARVGIGIKLINASNGNVIWKANHELVEEYLMIRPDLGKLSEELLAAILKEMPIEKRSVKKDEKAGKAGNGLAAANAAIVSQTPTSQTPAKASKLNAAPATAEPATPK